MPSETSKSKAFKIAYFLDPKGFERIVKILNDVSKDLEISIGCNDGSSIKFSSPNELLEFTNSESRCIQTVTLATPWGKKPHIYVRFRSTKYSSPVEYEISGDDKTVFYYSGKLDECVSTFRLWYTPIAFLDFTNLLLGFAFAAFIGIVLWAFFSLLRSDLSQSMKEEITQRDIFIQLGLWLAYGSLFVIEAAANLFRNRLFPIANFSISDGLNRFNSLEFWRRTLGVGFILSIIASLVATLLVK